MNMKKVASVALATALTASLAVSASAASVGHAHGECSIWNGYVTGQGVAIDSTTWTLSAPGGNTDTVFNNDTNDIFIWFDQTQGWQWRDMGELARTAATVSSYTKVTLPKGVRSTYTACKEAITVKEMNAICEATEGLNNLTVFKQRNISNVTAGETATFKLWTVGKRNSAVVLFRAEGATEWTILAQGEAGQKEVADVALPGNGAYAVCMAW